MSGYVNPNVFPIEL